MRKVVIGFLVLASLALTNPVCADDGDPTQGENATTTIADEYHNGVAVVKTFLAIRDLATDIDRKWNGNHPCAMVQPDGKTFIVPLIASNKSRGTINFSQDKFRGPGGHDNGIIHVEFVNFGKFKDVAVFQAKVDKHHVEDKDRGKPLKDGGETEIGIGASIRGFYFAIREEKTWNTEKILKENPGAYIKVTIVKQPAK